MFRSHPLAWPFLWFRFLRFAHEEPSPSLRRVTVAKPDEQVLRHFIYPLNPMSAAGYVFVGERGEERPTSYQGFRDGLDFRKPDEWGLATGYLKVRGGDMVWAYYAKPDGAIRAVGRISESPHWNDDWNR